jgi:small-conductance mechanosensitive channel
VHFDISQAWLTVQRMVNGLIAAAPRLIVALVLFGVFLLIARLVRSTIQRTAARHDRHGTLPLALGRLTQAGIVILGFLVAAAAAFPAFSPANLISVLGVGGVAIGFAFKDIFQNFLAGILILVTRPFHVGDQIIVDEFEGTVEEIQTRATLLKTYDGRRVVIPNSCLYVNTVTVNTAFTTRRMHYDFGIGYGDDIEQAKQIVLQVLKDVEGVLPDPVADVIVVNLGEYSVVLRARWWSDSKKIDELVAQDRVLQEVKRRFKDAGIDLPYPTRQVLLHDQTEETDGDRARQREGWPAGAGGAPRARASMPRPAEQAPNGSRPVSPEG